VFDSATVEDARNRYSND